MADEKVLAAQKWVNATYGKVSGYAKCPEDGKTGWATMYALTMGLQHELGISPVVASFGDGTLAKVTALGTIGIGWRKNTNIVKIIRHSLFCKGYWGGDTEREHGPAHGRRGGPGEGAQSHSQHGRLHHRRRWHGQDPVHPAVAEQELLEEEDVLHRPR
jgi:hypothetical protein